MLEFQNSQCIGFFESSVVPKDLALCTESRLETLKGNEHLEHLSVNRMIIWDDNIKMGGGYGGGRVWPWFVGLRLGTDDGLL